MKIMLTGAGGQVGWELARQLEPLGDVIALPRTACDLRDVENIPAMIEELVPDVIINAAAYTAVDRAEQEEALAMQVNATAVGVLAKEAARHGILLIHYSTDYVFDGSKSSPYTEEDVANPINVYGRSKFAGEEAIRQADCSYCIIRTSWVHSHRGSNFIKSVIKLASERDELRIVQDQIGTPTSATLLAEGTCTLLKDHDHTTKETFHLTASGVTNWFEYAKRVLQIAMDHGVQLKVTPDMIEPIPTSEYVTDARRPMNSCLDGTKYNTVFGVELPHWDIGVTKSVEGIVRCQC